MEQKRTTNNKKEKKLNKGTFEIEEASQNTLVNMPGEKEKYMTILTKEYIRLKKIESDYLKWKNSYEKALNDLEILKKDMIRKDAQIKTLLKKIKRFQNKMLKKDNEIKILNDEIKILNGEIAEQKALVKFGDLCRLFNTHISEKLLKKLWRDYAKQLGDKKIDLEDGLITPQQFDLWVKQHNDIVQIDLKKINDLMKLRNSSMHTDFQMSVFAQQNFIKNMKEEFSKPEHFPKNLINYYDIIQQMITKLSSIKLTRIN